MGLGAINQAVLAAMVKIFFLNLYILGLRIVTFSFFKKITLSQPHPSPQHFSKIFKNLVKKKLN
jgi:hypothetical protein